MQKWTFFISTNFSNRGQWTDDCASQRLNFRRNSLAVKVMSFQSRGGPNWQLICILSPIWPQIFAPLFTLNRWGHWNSICLCNATKEANSRVHIVSIFFRKGVFLGKNDTLKFYENFDSRYRCYGQRVKETLKQTGIGSLRGNQRMQHLNL